jgi:heme exporter protein CcmD
MLEHEPHTGFIVAAYVIATVVIVSMITVILSDYRALRKNLKKLGADEADRG